MRHRFYTSFRFSVLVLLCIASPYWQSAFAWGEDGHRIIATLADAQLAPTTRKEVARLLDLEPGESLASISTWADQHRNPATAPWHYVNFPRGNCHYEPERDCPDGKCVVAAIDQQIEVLRSSKDAEKKLTALKYLVHFMGDIHQPLHAGFGDDRGGNRYQLQAFMRGSNLHAVWDSGLIKALQQDNNVIVKSLLNSALPSSQTNVTAQGAAEESCEVVSQPGFYPDRLITSEYVDRYPHFPVVVRR